MQGINKTRHEHLIGALLQLESIRSMEHQESGCLEQAADYRERLETMHQNYECILTDLAWQIEGYEALYSQVKVQFLGKKLKELKKSILTDRATTEPILNRLHHNIQLAYGT